MILMSLNAFFTVLQCLKLVVGQLSLTSKIRPNHLICPWAIEVVIIYIGGKLPGGEWKFDLHSQYFGENLLCCDGTTQ